MTTSLLNQIRLRISELVGTMTISGGYHFDWGDVNVYENQEHYPSAKINYVQEVNLDETAERGSTANKYLNEVVFNIRCEYQNNNIEEIDPVEQATKLDEDLKKLFGINHWFPEIKGGYCFYIGHTPVYQQNADIPCGINWQLKTRYYQRRDNPSVYI